MRNCLPEGTVVDQYATLIRRLWILNLPEAIRNVTNALTMDKTLDDAAVVADTLYDSTPALHSPAKPPATATPSYSTVPFQSTAPAQQQPSGELQAEVQKLRSEVGQLATIMTEITRQVATLSLQARTPPLQPFASYAVGYAEEPQRSRGRSRSKSGKRDVTPARPQLFEDGKCYYHALFGAKAQKCREGCKMYDPKLAIQPPRGGN